MDLSAFNPYVYYATRYPFAKGQESTSRICYASSIYLISEGHGILRTRGRSYETGPGSLVHIPAGQLHDWLADDRDPMVHICCYFDWHFIDRRELSHWASPICYQPDSLQSDYVGPQLPYPISEVVQVTTLRPWIDLFQGFYKSGEYTNERTFMRNLTIQRNFQTFIEYFLTYMLRDAHIPDPRIIRIIECMETDLLGGTLKPLEHYYESLLMSRGHFFDTFKKTTGYAPTQYMNRYMIGRAMNDLLHTRLSITEIAAKYHFSSVHYFSRLFQKHTGCSPREYRKAGQFQ
ncbi:AraC family transcriptional regulator [Paenibacillus chungangensis]|uniref:AraC family transcriptional regulator n=1 Tax=Paenibacillus chungangensis TaxID=696535 RepID=A0ABW3HTI0_9BACL